MHRGPHRSTESTASAGSKLSNGAVQSRGATRTTRLSRPASASVDIRRKDNRVLEYRLFGNATVMMPTAKTRIVLENTFQRDRSASTASISAHFEESEILNESSFTVNGRVAETQCASVGVMKKDTIDWKKIDALTRESQAASALLTKQHSSFCRPPVQNSVQESYEARYLSESSLGIPRSVDSRPVPSSSPSLSPSRSVRSSQAQTSLRERSDVSRPLPPMWNERAISIGEHNMFGSIWKAMEQLKKAIGVHYWVEDIQARFPDRKPLDDLPSSASGVRQSSGEVVSTPSVERLLRTYRMKGCPSISRFRSHESLIEETTDCILHLLWPIAAATDDGSKRALQRENHRLTEELAGVTRDSTELRKELDRTIRDFDLWRRKADALRVEFETERQKYTDQLKRTKRELMTLQKQSEVLVQGELKDLCEKVQSLQKQLDEEQRRATSNKQLLFSLGASMRHLMQMPLSALDETAKGLFSRHGKPLLPFHRESWGTGRAILSLCESSDPEFIEWLQSSPLRGTPLEGRNRRASSSKLRKLASNGMIDAEALDGKAVIRGFYVPRKWMRFLDSTRFGKKKEGGVTALCGIIGGIYLDKHKSDYVENRGKRSQDLCDFVYDWFLKRHDLRPIAERHLSSFLSSLAFYLSPHIIDDSPKKVVLFGRFVGMISPPFSSWHLDAYLAASNALSGTNKSFGTSSETNSGQLGDDGDGVRKSDASLLCNESSFEVPHTLPAKLILSLLSGEQSSCFSMLSSIAVDSKSLEECLRASLHPKAETNGVETDDLMLKLLEQAIPGDMERDRPYRELYISSRRKENDVLGWKDLSQIRRRLNPLLSERDMLSLYRDACVGPQGRITPAAFARACRRYNLDVVDDVI